MSNKELKWSYFEVWHSLSKYSKMQRAGRDKSKPSKTNALHLTMRLEWTAAWRWCAGNAGEVRLLSCPLDIEWGYSGIACYRSQISSFPVIKLFPLWAGSWQLAIPTSKKNPTSGKAYTYLAGVTVMERCDVPSDCHIDHDNENLMQFAFLVCTFQKKTAMVVIFCCSRGPSI